MLVNQAALQGIYKSFKTIFNQAFGATSPVYTKIATEVPSGTRSEEYKWLGKLPRMREWIGDRVIQNLGAHEYTIKNKDWELTVGVDRNDIEDDTIGVYRPLVESLSVSAATHPDDLVISLFHLGFSAKCYDGQPFFADEHQDGNETPQSNKGTKKLSPTSYAAARAALMSLKDEAGNSLKIVPNLLVVSPANEEMGRKILMNEYMANGENNPWKGTAELLVLPELSANPDEWFLLDTSKPIKPFIFQKRKAPEFVAMDSPNDPNVFIKREFIYGVDSRDNAGFGLWHLAYGSTGATA